MSAFKFLRRNCKKGKEEKKAKPEIPINSFFFTKYEKLIQDVVTDVDFNTVSVHVCIV